MKTTSKLKKSADKIIYTVIAIVLLCSIITTMISYIYSFSEVEAYEKLHLETQQIKRDINLQMFSDRENLTTMARFTAQLYADGKDFRLLFDSFKEIGLFENIGLLLPNNHFITKLGTVNLNGKISFEEEIEKGEYISGRVKDLVDDTREVVRSAVPVKDDNGATIAMIYGMINLDTLKERYEDDAKIIDADLFVLEGENGNILINTKNKSVRNITELSVTTFHDGFSYKTLIEDLTHGKNGFTSFEALTSDDNLYAHYAPLEFGGWQIMLLQPERVVFSRADITGNYLMLISSLIILVMIAYVLMIFVSERKHLKISKNSSDIRKCLLGINQKIDRIYEALKGVTLYANARSSFVVDSFGVDYSFITPAQSYKKLTEEEKKYFISKLMAYVVKKRKEYHNEVYMSKITANKTLYSQMPDFYEFIKKHGIKTISFACVSNDNASISILGVVNPKNKRVYELLEDIAICFTMAISNQKHLVKTEAMAHTDALTGVANRMAYKNDIKNIQECDLSQLVCIYIDVNELNYYNNKYGHAAGDQMLVYIAETLKNEFPDSRVYRMGGDEFLIFAYDLMPDIVKSRIENANKKIEEMKYHVSMGIKYGDVNLTIEDILNAAEKMMYAEKAKYYQNKEAKTVSNFANRTMNAEHTGIKKIDAYMSAMGMRYLGALCIMHKKDTVQPILAPSYFSDILKETDRFSVAWKKYIYAAVKPEYHRTLLHFLEYDVLGNQIEGGKNPTVTYTKIDGEKVTLSIYPNAEKTDDGIDTIWVFEKENS